MVMAALGYLANSVGNLLHPESEATLESIVAVTAIFGELPFFLWLLIKGVDDSPSLRRGAFPSWEEKLALENVGGERARCL